MDISEKAVAEIRQVHWSQTVREHLEAVPNTDPTVTLDWFKAQVELGNMQPYGLFHNGEHVGSFLCSVNEGDNGAELVIDIAACSNPHVPASMMGFAAYEVIAKQAGCRVIRINTCRKGMVKKSQEHGYELCDYVMRKKIDVE
jgi:hypothetical protein